MPYRPPATPIEAYIGQEWFEKEQRLLLRKLWQFYTFASLVAKPNQFVTKKIAGIPIVLQNFNGELRAFENICLHRQSPLQLKPRGCRPLTCPYHGWNYGPDGKVKAVPFEEFYQFVPQQKEELYLRSFAVQKVGKLIFINLDPNPIPLERQFSANFIESMRDMSSNFDTQFIATTYKQRRFNWKLVFENLRDGLHANFLHCNSLNKITTFKPWMPEHEIWQAYLHERTIPDDKVMDPFDEVRKYFSKGGPDAPLDQPEQSLWSKGVKRYGSEDSYYNWLAFPSLHIASGGGYSFTLENYLPHAPNVTDVEVYFVLAEPKQKIEEINAILLNLLHSTNRVLTEDFTMLEQIQSGLHADVSAPHWGAYELRSHRMATWMTKVIDGQIKI